MRSPAAWLLLSACILASCTSKGEVVRAAQPHMEAFGELRMRALDLLELRAGVERNKVLYEAIQGEESAPDNLEPLLEQMDAENVQITQEQLDREEASFWRLLDRAFQDSPDVLQGEIVLVEKDGAISRFRHPREREVPAGVKWYGLRQQRTFAGLASCVTEGGSEPCLLIQLRPRDYSGSAGLTVGFRRAP